MAAFDRLWHLAGVDRLGKISDPVIFEKSAPPDTPLVPVLYTFLESVSVIVRRGDGRLVRVGFGIGEKVRVMEPRIQFLAANHRLKQEILLEGGTAIVGFPHDMRTYLENTSQVIRPGRPGNGWLEETRERS